VRLSEDTSFAVLGAGAAGLTSARTLLEAGYRNITVVESDPTAGGKCRAVEVDGKPFDLGCRAGGAARGNRHAEDLSSGIETALCRSYG
jgi:protoporphyrinogen oxidase